MKIKEDHRLYHDDDTPYAFVESPNIYDEVDHEYLVWHYTANNNAQSAINILSELKNPVSTGVSAHLVIDLDGTITQLVPFDKGAWHAGSSHWEGKRWLNHNSIGIEIVNDGKLKPQGDAQYRASSAKIYEESEILVGKHEHEFFDAGWPYYPQGQLDAILEVSKTLVDHYNLKDALGHEDIADERIGKVDPGPAFPKADFRERLFGRREPLIAKYEVTQTVEVIRDDGREPRVKMPARHPSSPLAPKSMVTVKKIAGEWALVKIKGAKKEGWVALEQLDLKKKKGKALTNAAVYAFQPDPAPPLHGVKILPKGAQVRILREEPEYVLVANLQEVPKYKLINGWIPKGSIKLIEVEETPIETED